MPTDFARSRRQFLKAAATAVAAPMIIPASALGGDGRPAPSNRIVMGAIGTGNMGKGDVRGFLHLPEVQFVAVCDVDAQRCKQAKAMVDEHYRKQPGKAKAPDCAMYNEFETIIERDDIDALTISTPDHWHAIPVIAAARAGKHMYCQKPLSLTIAEGRAMSDAVARAGVVFQTGSQQRSDYRFRRACELVRNGRIGKLHTMEVGLPTGRHGEPVKPQKPPQHFDYDRWLGPAPQAPFDPARCHWNFRWVLDYSGGQVTDWGAHHCDIAQWGNGTSNSGPVTIEGKGEFPSNGLYNAAVNYRFVATYADGVRMICSNRYPNGVKFIGDKGWIFVSRGTIDAQPKSMLRERIGPDEIHLYESRHHRRNLIDCIRTGRETVAPIENAHRSVTIAHLGNIAMLLGRKLKWDPAKEIFVGDETANRMRSRAMREPWRL